MTSTPDRPPAGRTTRSLVLVGILVLASGLRVYQLGHKSFWLDEIVTVNVAAQSSGSVWTHCVSKDVHPPLYYMVVHLVVPAGAGEAAHRFPSVVFGVLTVWVVYLVAKQVADDRVALAAAALVAVHPWHIEYAQDARCYTMLVLVASVMTLALVRLVGAYALDGTRRRVAAWWSVYVVAGLLTILSHNVGLIIVFCGMAAASVVVLVKASPRRRFLVAATLANLVLVAGCSWWLVCLARQSETSGLSWIDLPGFWGIVHRTTAWLIWSPWPALVRKVMEWSFVVLAAWGAWRVRRRPRALFLAVFGFGFVACMIGTSFIQPVIIRRTMLWFSVPAMILVPLGLARLGRTWFVVAILVCMTLMLTGLVHYYNGGRKADWRGLAGTLNDRADRDAVVVYIPFFADLPTEHYLGPSEDRFATVYRVLAAPDHTGNDRPAKSLVGLIDLVEEVSRHREVWVVVRAFADASGKPIDLPAFNLLATRARTVEQVFHHDMAGLYRLRFAPDDGD